MIGEYNTLDKKLYYVNIYFIDYMDFKIGGVLKQSNKKEESGLGKEFISSLQEFRKALEEIFRLIEKDQIATAMNKIKIFSNKFGHLIGLVGKIGHTCDIVDGKMIIHEGGHDIIIESSKTILGFPNFFTKFIKSLFSKV